MLRNFLLNGSFAAMEESEGGAETTQAQATFWDLAEAKKYAALADLMRKNPDSVLQPNPAEPAELPLSWVVKHSPPESGLVELILRLKGRDAFLLPAAELAVVDAFKAFAMPEFEPPEDDPEAPDTRNKLEEFVKAQMATEGNPLKPHEIRRIIACGVWSAADEESSERRVLYPSGDLFIGPVSGGTKNGRGLYVFAGDNAGWYFGIFKNDHKHGFGVLRYRDGSRFEGIFQEDLRAGVGVYRYANGDVYHGGFANDLRNGKGEYRCAHDRSSVAGEWKDGSIVRIKWTMPLAGTYHGSAASGDGVFEMLNGLHIHGKYDDTGAWTTQKVLDACHS